MRKLAFSIFSSTIVLIGMNVTGKDFSDLKIDGERIVKYAGSDTSVVIPHSIDGVEIRRIAPKAFAGTGVRHIILDGASIEIDSGDFAGCPNLISITGIYGGSISILHDRAFYGNTDLEEITVSEYIGREALMNCTNLRRLNINYLNCSIGPYGLANCTSLDTVVFYPETFEEDPIHGFPPEYSDYAFQNCSSLRYLMIPNEVVFLGKWGNNSSLISYKVPIRSARYIKDGCLYSPSYWYNPDLGDYELYGNILECYPSGRAIKELTMRNYDCFRNGIVGASFLEKLTIDTNPKLYEELGGWNSWSFTGCPKLKEVVLRDDYTIMFSGMFRGNPRLSVFHIPDSMRTIGPYALAETAIEQLRLPSRVNDISEGICHGCPDLVAAYLGDSLKVVGAHSFEGCMSLERVILPQITENIGKMAFFGCSSLQTMVSPSKLKSIENSAFTNSGLRDFKASEKLTTIGDSAFKNCHELETVCLQKETSSLGASPFDGCGSLKHIYITATTPPFASKAFEEIAEGVIAKVPAESVKKYREAEGWRKLIIEPITNALISLPQSTISLQEGMTHAPTYNVDFCPENVEIVGVEWTVSDAAVVEICSDGLLKALGPGDALLTCICTDSNGYETSATCNVIVDGTLGADDIEINSDATGNVSGRLPKMVYSIDGKYVGVDAEHVQPGIYIVSDGERVTKRIISGK